MNGLRAALAALVPAAALLVAGCSPAAPPAPDEVPHGFVAGAEETAEAQSRLVTADHLTGAVRVLDLVTGEISEVAHLDAVERIATDGRFAYVATADGAVHVVDSGAWTVDHGDHVHHYRAPVKDVGRLPGPAAELVAVHSDPTTTAVSFADGTVHLLDRARLDAGEIVPVGRVAGAGRPVHAVPYRERVLVPLTDSVEVRDRQGGRVAGIEPPCPQPSGSATTRRGVVFGCADGALLVAEREKVLAGEKIPYPGAVPAERQARAFGHRPGSSTLAAPAGTDGIWSLDVSRRAWTLLPVGPVVASCAVGEGGPVLVLTGDGVLRAIDPAGNETAQAALLGGPPAAGDPAPVIHVDPARAYVNDPARGLIYEIDHGDGLRVARTFTVPGRAGHFVETGR
ncbi:hypothetical protein WEH80_09445 [Actinomycetes bacterium KLBMP 9759]